MCVKKAFAMGNSYIPADRADNSIRLDCHVTSVT